MLSGFSAATWELQVAVLTLHGAKIAVLKIIGNPYLLFISQEAFEKLFYAALKMPWNTTVRCRKICENAKNFANDKNKTMNLIQNKVDICLKHQRLFEMSSS